MLKLFLDCETSDLSPEIGRLLQFGYILDNNGEVTEDEFIIKKDIRVSKKTTELTGLKQSDIDAGIDPLNAFGRIASLIETSDVLIGHNIIKFDLPFIITRLSVYEIAINPRLDQIIIDTAALFKAIKGGYIPTSNESLPHFQRRVLSYRIYGLKFNLDLAMRHFEIKVREGEERHTALADIKYTKLVYEKLRNLPQFKQFNLP
ncbi:MAG: 3'-5' exonuclease [Candidatus Hodarchaeota archaeon]